MADLQKIADALIEQLMYCDSRTECSNHIRQALLDATACSEIHPTVAANAPKMLSLLKRVLPLLPPLMWCEVWELLEQLKKTECRISDGASQTMENAPTEGPKS